MTKRQRGAGKQVTQVTASAQSALNATNTIINGLAQWESTATVTAPATTTAYIHGM